ncbi:MAG: hypothetical protein LIP08_07065 [Bacteroides sp.]|nr:hypothetical protein [Bacteroides sp.]
MRTDTLAAIDIGSNAIRLMVQNIDNRNGLEEFKKVAFLRVPVRLGEDVFSKGKISKGKSTRLSDALRGFSYVMKAYQVESFLAYATSAMRDAQNGRELIQAIHDGCGIPIQIISGMKEAEIILEAGGLSSVDDPSGNYLFMDVGGGSTEVIIHSRHQNVEAHSFQIGTVRMLAGAVTAAEQVHFTQWLEEAYRTYAPLSIIASGGNINKAYKLIGKQGRDPVNYIELRVLHEALQSMSYEERMLNYRLNAYRADVIVPALELYVTAARILKAEHIFVPKLGLVDGMIHHLYTTRYKNREKCT